MSAEIKLWKSEILENGSRKIILTPRNGEIYGLILIGLTCVPIVIGMVCTAYEKHYLTLAFVPFILFVAGFGVLAILGAAHEIRQERFWIIEPNKLTDRTIVLTPKLKFTQTFKNAKIKVLATHVGGARNQAPATRYMILLYYRKDFGFKDRKFLYTSDTSATESQIVDLAQQIAAVTGWPIELPKGITHLII